MPPSSFGTTSEAVSAPPFATAGCAACERERPYLALLSGDDQHDPSELVAAFDALEAAGADYVQGSRWRAGGKVVGGDGRSRPRDPDLLARLQPAQRAAGHRCDQRLQDLPDLDPGATLGSTSSSPWLDSYDLEPYVLYKAIRGGYKVIEHPCTVIYHAKEGYTKMRGIRDWWRLFRPALLLRTGVKR